jgi:2-polyprenyl-3-methyl-5-hydroxy-6-metoxy-1,4-benzoquinol methylase
MSARRALRRLLDPILDPVPKHISSRFSEIGDEARGRIEVALEQNFYGPTAADYLNSDEGRRHLAGHVTGRLANDRGRVIPWLDSARRLDGARILELGCGTGSSTVALCEQGADVVAVDLNRRHMAVAQERCAAHGVKPQFVVANAANIAELFSEQRFDFIIFFATLEHMTYEERLIAMRNTWNMLAPGGLWAVVEAPNRLHYSDDHSAMLPFYHWLPDALAWDYGGHSPRAAFRDQVSASRSSATKKGDDYGLALQRFGRGVSYHEFELALAPLAELRVVSSLYTHTPGLRALRWLQKRTTLKGRYQHLLSQICPQVHPAFFEPWLNFILEKD